MKKYIACLVILALVEISLSLYLTFWKENFWNYIANKEQLHFLQQLGIFTGVALTICLVSGISGYILSLTVIVWRKHLNTKAFANRDLRLENINQRHQEDCWQYPDLFLNLIFGFGKSLVYIVVFGISLLISFSWGYLLALITYSIIGMAVTKWIATPLIALNYEQQRAEATYRNDLSISNFEDCIRIMFGLAKKTKHLTYFQQLYGQVGVVLPLVMVAPLYFHSGMTLGLLMRFNSLGGTILDNLSYGVTSFAIINKWISCRRRLRELGVV